MLTENVTLSTNVLDLSILPVTVGSNHHEEISQLATYLSPCIPWGERQRAARKLGYLRDKEAVPALLQALPNDNFWMVRCAIIQALELISDSSAIDTLKEVALKDAYQVVRSYANKAVERIAGNSAD